ncbi:zonular occludens toxin domain-containing protein [Acidovorax sp. SUPP2539]|uniref:zonular occludens toxin domain-containing protein n=1 Tax=Acidovorax sp. SUPP2539 TaxID=2920878 RepID=UPI0023DE35CE|nr:zonular occludens toxin domain-containing protein [Acidovorax sp. SUPP2539]GKS88232.1 zonular occludens toxin [Acidovorax sp. SUPP2539]
MLYLITGANGAGKTLNALKWVRERQVKETRPVCHNGRFDVVEDGELKDWKKIDFKNWQDEPDGTIFLVDECHNDLPNRPTGAVVPDHVKMLAEHRRRGFDFYLISQHPGNIDSFVRRLIGSPGWHRHLKRTFGGSSLVSCIQWDAVNPNCERNGSGSTGEVTMVPFPKHVFGWYRSASLHTAKVRIPKAVWICLGAIATVAVAGYFGISSLKAKSGIADKPATSAAGPQSAAADTPMFGGSGRDRKPMTALEYLQDRKPRLPDFPHTSPVYDGVTQPTVAPYPAACVQMGSKCKCYTQQATLMQVTASVCEQIVRQGYFVDWAQHQQGPQPAQQQVQLQMPQGIQQPQQLQPLQARTVPVPAPVQPQEGLITPEQLSSALAVRNPAYAGLPRVSTR